MTSVIKFLFTTWYSDGAAGQVYESIDQISGNTPHSENGKTPGLASWMSYVKYIVKICRGNSFAVNLIHWKQRR